MKISEKWLRERVNPRLDTRQLAERLIMAGLEVVATEPAGSKLDKVVVGEILSITPHPSADHLKICEVNIGERASRTIVSGAFNIAAGLHVPVALPGATLPNKNKILETEIRGVMSNGMLCSAMDLGLEESSDGVLILESLPKPGTALEHLFDIDDKIFDIDLTPNRGDWLSITGIAREVAVLTGAKLKSPRRQHVTVESRRRIKISLEAPQACPYYVGRVIENIDSHAVTPLWMKERLRRSGLRSVNPIVDVTNYVQIEIGQPMHAFDFNKLTGSIHIRHARKNESLMLLNGNQVTLEKGSLLIADDRRPLAIAGVMGGLESAVDGTTQSVFLESAHFRPESVVGRARSLGMQTESAQRFERGVDPALPRLAMERATDLLLAIAGGKAGPVIEQKSKRHLPKTHTILLRKGRIRRLLGLNMSQAQVRKVLAGLGMKVRRTTEGWRVTPPSYRFDIRREADLIEDLARVYGYEKITPTRPRLDMRARPLSETRLTASRIRTALVDRGYQEVITYSFVDPDLQKLLDSKADALTLVNPIAATMSVMRTGLWPGLLLTLLYNQNRQVERQQLFEIGRRFLFAGSGISQEYSIAGAVIGSAEVPQWGLARREVDFFDTKADVEALLALTGKAGEYRFQPASHPALHPGMTAEILFKDERIGWLGGVHPETRKKLGLDRPVFLFELAYVVFERTGVPVYREISRFPAIRRDIAVTVDASLPAAKVMECVKNAAGSLLINLELFDEYHGKGIDSGRKSFSMGLTLQESSRTLRDSEVEALLNRVIDALEAELNAKLRQ